MYSTAAGSDSVKIDLSNEYLFKALTFCMPELLETLYNIRFGPRQTYYILQRPSLAISQLSVPHLQFGDESRYIHLLSECHKCVGASLWEIDNVLISTLKA